MEDLDGRLKRKSWIETHNRRSIIREGIVYKATELFKQHVNTSLNLQPSNPFQSQKRVKTNSLEFGKRSRQTQKKQTDLSSIHNHKQQHPQLHILIHNYCALVGWAQTAVHCIFWYGWWGGWMDESLSVCHSNSPFPSSSFLLLNNPYFLSFSRRLLNLFDQSPLRKPVHSLTAIPLHSSCGSSENINTHTTPSFIPINQPRGIETRNMSSITNDASNQAGKSHYFFQISHLQIENSICLHDVCDAF